MSRPLPVPVAHPVMLQRWATLTFLHWRYDPAVVQRLLPSSLEVETFGGAAWVGLVPFAMRNVRAPGMPALPWVSNFPETNVRTYVRGPHGATGIWFLSLDASRLGAVATARATYRLPYMWSAMAVRRRADRVRYLSRRRWPGPRGAGCDVVVEVGRAFEPEDLGALDHFLTARFALFSGHTGRLFSRAEHPPWLLRRASVIRLQQDLVEAAGLPSPAGDPLVHFAPGVDVRIGLLGLAQPPGLLCVARSSARA